MSDPLILTDLLKLDTGASGLIDLFEIEIDESTWIYITPFNETTGPVVGSPVGSPATWMVQFRDATTPTQVNTYVPIPCALEGIEHKSEGPLPQPRFVISNILRPGADTSFEGLLAGFTFKSLLGNKIIRRRTMQKYLFGEAQDQNPPIEFVKEVYILDRIQDENPQTVTFTLVSPIDLENVKLPNRIVVGNACPWKYTAAGVDKNEWEKTGGCTWPSDGAVDFNGTEVNIYVSIDDYYIILNASGNEWSAGSKNKDTIVWTVDSTDVFKVQPNGNLSYDVVFASGDINIGTDRVTSTNNFITGDLIVYTGPGGMGLSNGQEYWVNVTSSGIAFYNSEANSISDTSKIPLTASGSGHTLSTAVQRYWQAKITTTQDPKAANQSDWETIHRAVTYASNIPIKVFTDDLFNSIVIYNSRAWKGVTSSQEPNNHILANPELGTYWNQGDFCGKRLTSCAKRFGINYLMDLPITAPSVAFSAGDIITGNDSNASAYVEANNADTLRISNVNGAFINGETIQATRAWPQVAKTATAGTVSNVGPTVEPYGGAVLPFGAFPTARAFDGA